MTGLQLLLQAAAMVSVGLGDGPSLRSPAEFPAGVKLAR
jgi:hypothetical protein